MTEQHFMELKRDSLEGMTFTDIRNLAKYVRDVYSVTPTDLPLKGSREQFITNLIKVHTTLLPSFASRAELVQRARESDSTVAALRPKLVTPIRVDKNQKLSAMTRATINKVNKLAAAYEIRDTYPLDWAKVYRWATHLVQTNRLDIEKEDGVIEEYSKPATDTNVNREERRREEEQEEQEENKTEQKQKKKRKIHHHNSSSSSSPTTLVAHTITTMAATDTAATGTASTTPTLSKTKTRAKTMESKTTKRAGPQTQPNDTITTPQQIVDFTRVRIAALRHVSFTNFLIKLQSTMTKFLNTVPRHEPYGLIVTDTEECKSGTWVIQLLFAYGMFGDRDYPVIIVGNSVENKKTKNNQIRHFFVVDDAAYSGEQLQSTTALKFVALDTMLSKLENDKGEGKTTTPLSSSSSSSLGSMSPSSSRWLSSPSSRKMATFHIVLPFCTTRAQERLRSQFSESRHIALALHIGEIMHTDREIVEILNADLPTALLTDMPFVYFDHKIADYVSIRDNFVQKFVVCAKGGLECIDPPYKRKPLCSTAEDYRANWV